MQEQVRRYRGLHPEDVKAVIRKKFGTIGEFHRVYGLPATGLQDILRGRPSQRIADAVDEVLAEARESKKLDSSHESAAQHQNAEAK